MLFVSLGLAAMAIAVAGYLFEQLRHRGVFAKVAVPLLATAFGEFVAMATLALHFFLLCPVLLVIGLICLAAKARITTFVMWSAGTAILIMLSLGLHSQLGWAEARRQYPLEPIAARLAHEAKREAEPMASRDAPRDETIEQHDATMLDALEEDVWKSYSSRRARALAYAHRSQVQQFIDSQGFGWGRMPRPTPYDLPRTETRNARYAGIRPESAPSSDSEPARQTFAPMAPREETALNLVPLHRESLVDFVNPRGFGWVKDREHAAGFEPHAFSQLPKLQPASAKAFWRTARVELVSLLKHDQPMVYVSSRLPKMDELRDAPVRPLDAFELGGLSKLQQGDELVVHAAINRVQMLGSIPALKQCLECHQVQRGELLGAFSYEFLRDPAISADGLTNSPFEPEL
ncbi:MAG TPA: hypothetical protein VN699_07315 [Pirellulales bacterium]|nr:hypothetical protein [Pirellulales bacterium]